MTTFGNEPTSANRKAKLAFSASVLALILSAGLVFIMRMPKAEVDARTVSGQVRCASGNPVVGIWIDAPGGDSDGWADWSPDARDPSLATFSRRVWTRGYALDVGCGGTRDEWAANVPTDLQEGAVVSLLCYDKPAKDQSKKCVNSRD
jgi:hypothetical protein